MAKKQHVRRTRALAKYLRTLGLYVLELKEPFGLFVSFTEPTQSLLERFKSRCRI